MEATSNVKIVKTACKITIDVEIPDEILLTTLQLRLIEDKALITIFTLLGQIGHQVDDTISFGDIHVTSKVK